MYVIKDTKFILIPLAFNEFCNDISSLRDSSKYVGKIHSRRIVDKNVLTDVINYCACNDDVPIVIDMNNIISYCNRDFNRLLSLSCSKIIITRIDINLIDRVNEDLKGHYIKNKNALCSSDEMVDFYKHNKDDITNIDHIEILNVVQWMKQCVNKENITELRPLDSSGVFCNMYINVKKLFVDPLNYYYVIYQMICMIDNSNIAFDALVSVSRNGANIAEIIGWLLNKKVIYCPSLGPKFSLATYMVENKIRKNGKYVYIFDFMCLGTEAKMLNALLSFAGANLVGGFGIANYIDLEQRYQFSVINKMNSLIDVQREKIGYRIAGSKEEIGDMLVEEKEEYGTRLFEV